MTDLSVCSDYVDDICAKKEWKIFVGWLYVLGMNCCVAVIKYGNL